MTIAGLENRNLMIQRGGEIGFLSCLKRFKLIFLDLVRPILTMATTEAPLVSALEQIPARDICILNQLGAFVISTIVSRHLAHSTWLDSPWSENGCLN